MVSSDEPTAEMVVAAAAAVTAPDWPMDSVERNVCESNGFFLSFVRNQMSCFF